MITLNSDSLNPGLNEGSIMIYSLGNKSESYKLDINMK